MRPPSASYLKVPYDLRPAKQIERRMLVETFQALAAIGFPISSYQYTGFGSVYFFDFIVFHKLLGITRMLSVEVDQKIRKRVKFNKPFRSVEVRMGDITDEIPNLSADRGHILWLDYDQNLNKDHVEDIWLAGAKLSAGSILLVTVDVEAPVKNAGPNEWRDYFRAEAANYLGTRNSLKDFVESELLGLNQKIITSAIHSGLSSRDITYIPMFCFSYADGHEMLTLGGMLGNEDHQARIQHQYLQRLPFLRFTEDATPQRIMVPKLTRKERIYLDKAMPCPAGWSPKHFEIPPDYVEAYRNTYRFFPNYAELLF